MSKSIESALGVSTSDIRPLGGGDVGEVYRARLQDGSLVVAKVDRKQRQQLELEGFMLGFLADHSHLPVPSVLHCDAQLLILEFIPGRSTFSKRTQEHAAELLANLHEINAQAFGFERDTLIGGLPQPNPWTESWLDFFRDQRIVFMSQCAINAGKLPQAFFARILSLCERLDEWLDVPARPSLIHGDAWTGNILAEEDQITGFLDPAIYYADAEIELAFTTLFGTFDSRFFNRYQEIRPIQPGFMEIRRDLYNLYPLLVHVRLFGGHYVSAIDNTLRRFGI